MSLYVSHPPHSNGRSLSRILARGFSFPLASFLSTSCALPSSDRRHLHQRRKVFLLSSQHFSPPLLCYSHTFSPKIAVKLVTICITHPCPTHLPLALVTEDQRELTLIQYLRLVSGDRGDQGHRGLDKLFYQNVQPQRDDYLLHGSCDLQRGGGVLAADKKNIETLCVYA